MTLLTLSVLGGLMVFLVFAFFYSLGKVERVDIFEKLSDAEEYLPSYEVSDSFLGRSCDKFIKRDRSGRFFKLATYFDVNMEYLQNQIRILHKEDTISAVEILAMKILGVIAGAAIAVYALGIKDLTTGIIALIVFISLYYLPQDKIKEGLKERENQVVRELPLFIEQVYMCIEAGAPLQESLMTVAENNGGVLGPLFKEAFIKSSYGGKWEDELYQMIRGVNVEPLEDFVNDILISHAKGTSINDTLRNEVDHIHKIASARQKEMIAKLDTKMMVMFVVFGLLPVLLIVGAPIFLQAMSIL